MKPSILGCPWSFFVLALSAVTVCVRSTTRACANSPLGGSLHSSSNSISSSSSNSSSSSSDPLDDELAVLQVHLSSTKSATRGDGDELVNMSSVSSSSTQSGWQAFLRIRQKKEQLAQLLEKGFNTVVKPFLDHGLSKGDRFVVLGIVAATLTGVTVRACQAFRYGKAEATYSTTSRTIQSLFLFQSFLLLVQSTVIIPESYDITMHVGHGAADSGWLIGAAWPLSCIGAPLAYWATRKPWKQKLVRKILVSLAFMQCVFALLYAIAANPPLAWGWSPNVRFGLLIFSRLVEGFGFGAGEPCFRMMAQHVSPKEELVPLNVAFSFMMSLGIGLGPLLSSAMSWVFDLQSIEARSSVPLCAVAVLWAIYGLAVLWAVPPELGELKERSTSTHSLQALITDYDSEPNVKHRKHLWLHAALLCLERAFLISALEAASAFILEEEYFFPREDIGLTIACTFLTGLPILSCLYSLKNRYQNGQLLILLTITCSVATLFLFQYTGGAPSCIWLLLADCTIFPTAYAANGIAEGVAAQHAVPGTWFSQESLAIFRTLTVGGIGRFLSPPFARALLAVGGRNAYAAAQAVISLVSVMSAWKMNEHEQDLFSEKDT